MHRPVDRHVDSQGAWPASIFPRARGGQRPPPRVRSAAMRLDPSLCEEGRFRGRFLKRGVDTYYRALAKEMKDRGGVWVLVCHLPSAILCLPAFVSRSSPGNSSMYPSWISRSLCSGGIVRCIGPLAQLRSDTNSSWVSGGADKPCAIPRICASDCPFSS